MDVTLPNGVVIQNVPDGTTQSQLLATLDKNGIAHGVTPSPAAPKAPLAVPQASTYADVIKSAAEGLKNGAVGLATFPADAAAFINRKAGQVNQALEAVPGYKQYVEPVVSDPNSAQNQAALQKLTTVPVNQRLQQMGVPDYQPQTTAGKYAATIASFAPVALGGQGSLLARAARTIIPAVASEGAGEFAEGTPYEGAARVGGALAGAVVGNPVAAGAIRSINAAAVGKGLPAFLDPAATAGAKMRAAVDADGGPNTIGSNIVDWQGSGASAPTLVDVGGNNVRRLVRSAASGGSGEAQTVATDYAGRVRANFQDQVLDHTNGLTPEVPDSATTYADKLAQAQGDVAKTTYAAPYAEPAKVTPDMVSALQGQEGARAINRAFTAASANRDVQQMGELQDLKDVASSQSAGQDPTTGRFRTLGDALSNLSAGSLDRVRIAMRDIGINYAANNNKATAAGYFGRVGDIDTALDQTPGLQPARQVYRQMQAGRDALDVGGGILSTPANEYAGAISDLAAKGGPPNLGPGLRVGARQALVNKLETGADGATGAAKTISQASRATSNLGATFGDDRAAQYQAALGNEVRRVGNADFISPNTGSQTALRTEDSGLIASVPTSKVEFLGKVIETLRGRGATLTDAERTAIVRMGTTPADLRMLAQRNPRLSSAAIAQIAATNTSQPN